MSPGLWRLGTYHLPVFLVRSGGESLLFEVGISSTATLVLEQLAGLSVPREEIKYVVLTHAHSDHATGGAWLAAGLPKAELVMSGASHRHLSKPETAEQFQAEDDFTTSAIEGHNPADVSTPNQAAPDMRGRILFKEPGESISLGGIDLELMGADGHVPGGLVGWLPAEGVLLASDSAGYCSLGEPAYPLYFVSYGGYQANLAKIAGMNPEILALGHQDCFTGPAAAEYLEKTRDLLADEHQRVIKGVASDRSQEDLAQDISDRYYHDELAVFAPDAMMDCCRILVRRSLEHEEG